VGTLTNVAEIATGFSHSCAAKDDGTAWCWGLNNKGQLGNNSTTDSSTPVQVVGAGGVGTLTNVAEIAAGLQHSCAAKDDGTAWCWGLNDKGQLGNNSTTDSSTPVQVVGAGGVGVLDTIILVGAGNTHTCAAKQTHTVWCWGLNNESQLGNNSTTDSSTPVQAIGT
jgi:alpha-tubulin suppressor-like RCC1 family protein